MGEGREKEADRLDVEVCDFNSIIVCVRADERVASP